MIFQNFQKFPNFQKRDGERSRCWEKKLNFQGALFLCSSSVTLFKFAPLCCLFARNSVSIVQIYFTLAFEGKRVLNGLVCKYRNTCSNAKICVFCQIQKHLLQCQKFVYLAAVTNAKGFCDHLNNEVAEFLQMTIALPRVVIYVQYLRKYRSIFFNFVCKNATKSKNYKSIHPPNKKRLQLLKYFIGWRFTCGV